MLVKNGRTKEQILKMKRLTREKKCPLCRKDFEVVHASPVVKEGKYWLITDNDFPYDGTRFHFMLVAQKHIVDVSEVDDKGWIEFGDMLNFIKTKWKISGGTLLMRTGNMSFTGATIAHLHAHFIVGGKSKKSSEWINAKVGYKK